MKNRKWIIGILSAIFIAFIIFIKTNLIEGFDTFIYNLVTYKMSDGLNVFYKIITFFGSTIFIVSLCVVLAIVFFILKKKNYAFIEVAVIVISTIVNNVIKLIVRRARPTVLALVHESSFSFPSGHTMASVSMYGIILYFILKSNLNKTLKIISSILLISLPLLVAISRIYLGAHFASDVIGAFVMSIILLVIETYYIDKKNWL